MANGQQSGFDVSAARKAGYSDDDILSHLTQTRAFDVGAAVKAGYSKSEIIDHLSTVPSQQATPAIPGAPGGLPDLTAQSRAQAASTVQYTPERVLERGVARGFGLDPDKLARAENVSQTAAWSIAAKETGQNLTQGAKEFVKEVLHDPFKVANIAEAPASAIDKSVKKLATSKQPLEDAGELAGNIASIMTAAAIPESKGTKIPGKPVIEVAGETRELPATSGMVSASTGLKGVESIVGRSALFGGSLKKVYASAQEAAGKTIADVLKDSTGADVQTFADASEHLKQAAKQAYAPFDAYNKEAIGQALQDVLNNKEFIETAGGPSVAAQVVAASSDNSIASLKMIRDKLYQSANRLQNANRGTEANEMFQLAAKSDADIQGMVSKMPPEIQATYNQGQALWRQHSAMNDMREVFAGATTPAERPITGMQELRSRISGQKLSADFNSDLQASRDNVARLTQAVGPENAQTIRQVATYLAKLPEAGASGIGARLLDITTVSSLAAAPIAGVTPHVVGLALGVKGLAKVLSYPGGASVARVFLEAPVKSARYQFALMVMGKMINQGETPPTPAPAPTAQPAQPQQAPVQGGASIGDILKSRGVTLPVAAPNTPALPFRPGAGIPH